MSQDDESPPPPDPPKVSVQPARSSFVHPDTIDDLSWKAFWIGFNEPPRPNQWTAFRRVCEFDEPTSKALARIAVDSKYWLWVNGQLVIREGGLKRGPTPTDTYFDEVDLGKHLIRGTNTFAVLVWYFGKEGFSHKSSGRSGLLFELRDEAGKTLLLSDSLWRTTPHPAFGDTDSPHPNYRLPESNIRFDATRDLIGWEQTVYDDTDWSEAIEFGRAPCGPWNRLVRRPIPFWQESDLLDYVSQTRQGTTVIAHLPHNGQVTPFLEIEAPAGFTVRIQTDNYRGGSAPNVRAEYVTREGGQAFECYGWMNGHAVHYEMPAGVNVIRLAYRENGYATRPAGSFHCDDPFVNHLRAKAERTLYLTMRDTYMDCPDRERAQWWGDVVNVLGEVFYAFDRDADALTRKAILELAGWQKPDGVLFSPVPAGNWDRDLPMQMLASISRQGFWTYAFYSGDFDTLRHVYPAVQRYLEIWDLRPDGLIDPRPGSWPWGDWGDNVDMTLLSNIWYHLALQGQRHAALALARAQDIPWLDERLRSIERAFDRAFWNGHAYRSFDYTGETDDRGNALAVVAGLAPREHFPDLIHLLQRTEHASPYMEKYVLEALCLMGRPALAQERMKRRYAKMVEHPVHTTLWEGWGIGLEGFGGGSINHAWSGGPLTIMSQYFAGIAPLAPAFTHFGVFPQPGALTQLSATVETKHGRISVALQAKPEALELRIEVPPGTTAVAGLPLLARRRFRQVLMNGQPIWPADSNAKRSRGVEPLGLEEDYLKFSMTPGAWSFVGEFA